MALAMESNDDDDDDDDDDEDSFTEFLFAHCENRSSSSSLLRWSGVVEELSNLVSVGIGLRTAHEHGGREKEVEVESWIVSGVDAC
jgi:hypothetical protein